MNKEGDGRLIVEKAEELEKEITDLTRKISLEGTGVEILRTGLRKTSVAVVYNITQCVSEFHEEQCLKYLQRSLSELQALEYYNYVSRKVGYFSSSSYLHLRERIKDMKEHLFLSIRNLKHPQRDGFFGSPT